MKIGIIGEPLIELSLIDGRDDRLQRRPGGDSLNTAIYLSRLIDQSQHQISYLTRLGDDASSRWLISELEAEAVETDLIGIEPGGRPGMCQIENLPDGDRHFAYWRSDSPVRRMFIAENKPLVKTLNPFSMLIFSAVSLAVLQPSARDALLGQIEQMRAADVAVVFDTNYRPSLWPSADVARCWIERASNLATLLMPTTDDLRPLYGDRPSSHLFDELAHRYKCDIVMKDGGGPVRTCINGTAEVFSLDCSGPRLDTTGAGDSFNAGFIASRLRGESAVEAVETAHQLASIVVAHHNAVIPLTAMPWNSDNNREKISERTIV